MKIIDNGSSYIVSFPYKGRAHSLLVIKATNLVVIATPGSTSGPEVWNADVALFILAALSAIPKEDLSSRLIAHSHGYGYNLSVSYLEAQHVIRLIEAKL